MSSLHFAPFRPDDLARCLELFDRNCPEFFAPNEREEYETFLRQAPSSYELCLEDGAIVGAFGLIADSDGTARVSWILVDPTAHGRGIGGAMITRAMQQARRADVAVIHIAASHRSAPFFARFGAAVVRETMDGWGPGMHRVDMVLQVYAPNG